MDFMQRGSHQNQTVNPTTVPGGDKPSGRGRKRLEGGFLRYLTGLLLLSATVLLIGLILSFVFGAPKSQSKLVNTKGLQAVFLNNGQVYFGNIKTVNDKYVQLQNIYYLRVNQTVQPNQSSNSSSNANDVSLVKLGCELHGPEDRMVINADEVTFWENLKDDGQVAKAVANYVKANPNGQNCAAQSNSNSSSTAPTTDKKQ